MIRIEVQDEQVQAALSRLRSATSDLKPAMQSIGQDLAENVRLGFRDSTDPWGRPWAPLSPVTIMRRRGGSSQPLMDTGALRNSITSQADATSVTVGTNDKKAKTHQFGAGKGQYGRTSRGAPIPWGRIPARPFLPIQGSQAQLPPDWQEEVLDTIGDFIEQAIRG